MAESSADALGVFVEKHGVKVLTVAGPRASNEAGSGEFVMSIPDKAFTDIGG